MYRHLLLLILIAMSLCTAQTTIAVIDFDARGIPATEVATLTDRFRDELTKSSQYTVIERGKMEDVLKEQGFQQSGCTSDECAVEVGRLVGVQQMVGGSIGKVVNVFSVSVRIIDVQSGEISNVTTYDHTGDIGGLLTVGMRQVVVDLLTDVDIPVVSQSRGLCTLFLTTVPSGAAAWIDDVQITGITPLMIENQKSGEHIITARKADYLATKTVNLITGEIVKIDLKLEEGIGNIRVITTPFEAEVFIDGVSKGLSPLVINGIKTGNHQLAV